MTNPFESEPAANALLAAEIDLLYWLSGQGLAGTEIPTLLAEFCQRLRPLGIVVARGHVATSTLDPQQQGFSLTWKADQRDIQSANFPHQNEQSEDFLQSPIYYMISNRLPELRCQLRPSDDLAFPLLEELRSQGLTDYYATLFGFGWTTNSTTADGYGELGMICSLTTAASEGFGSTLDCLKRLLPTFALAIKSAMMGEVTHKVFSAYLGPDAAARVLRGEVRRGSAQRIHAAILFADLQGFTRLADTVPSSDLVPMLNRYLECIVTPIEEHGGQVLKFMGDGLLATFDQTISDAALAAAIAALADVKSLNTQRETANQPTMNLDIALHLGEVLYGNVGSATRLDFTVIGPAVNEAARMETLCDDLEVNLILSQAFREKVTDSCHNIVGLGEHRLRGVREAKALFTIKHDAD